MVTVSMVPGLSCDGHSTHVAHLSNPAHGLQACSKCLCKSSTHDLGVNMGAVQSDWGRLSLVKISAQQAGKRPCARSGTLLGVDDSIGNILCCSKT